MQASSNPGYGKSICYQLLPFVFDVMIKLGRTNAPLVDRSVVLVISPLVSDTVVYITFRVILQLFYGMFYC